MRSLRAIAAAVVLASGGAMAQDLDPAQLYRDGVAARRAGQTERAIDLLRRAVSANPADADAQLQLGLALGDAGRLDEAEQAFRRTLEIAPDYNDARIALARIALRRGAIEQGLAELAPITAGQPGYEEAQTVRAQLDQARREQAQLDQARQPSRPAERRWRLDAEFSYSDLTSPQPSWREGNARLAYRLSPETRLAAAAELADRFDRFDAYFEGYVEQRLSSRVIVYGLAGATPGADFRPEWQIGGGASVRVRDREAPVGPTVLTLDVRHADYPVDDVETIVFGGEQYFGGAGWVTARWISTIDSDGNYESGWFLRGDAVASPRWRVFAGLSDAPDTSEGVVIETFTLFGGLVFDVSDDVALRLSAAREDRNRGFDRTVIALGLGYAF